MTDSITGPAPDPGAESSDGESDVFRLPRIPAIRPADTHEQPISGMAVKRSVRRETGYASAVERRLELSGDLLGLLADLDPEISGRLPQSAEDAKKAVAFHEGLKIVTGFTHLQNRLAIPIYAESFFGIVPRKLRKGTSEYEQNQQNAVIAYDALGTLSNALTQIYKPTEDTMEAFFGAEEHFWTPDRKQQAIAAVGLTAEVLNTFVYQDLAKDPRDHSMAKKRQSMLRLLQLRVLAAAEVPFVPGDTYSESHFRDRQRTAWAARLGVQRDPDDSLRAVS